MSVSSSSRPRLLMAGVGPLPPEQPDKLYAPGVQIWGMACECIKAGCDVRLVCVAFGDTAGIDVFDFEAGDASLTVELPIPRRVEGPLSKVLAELAVSFQATSTISSTDLMNHALATSGLDLPMWFAFFGDPMAERQMQATHGRSDEGLFDQWAMVAPAWMRGDRFSGCSDAQCSAILGQLGAVGRLNQYTAGYPFLEKLALWIEPIPMNLDHPPLLRGVRTPQDATILIQTGGFNTWLDIEGLFKILEGAMNQDPKLHFAATGGRIEGHHHTGFDQFKAWVEASTIKDRVHFLGWLPLGLVPRVMAEADIGINIDLDVAEGKLGSRTRLLDWAAAGLKVISTPGCELAFELAEMDQLTLIPHGDYAQGINTVLRLVQSLRTKRHAYGGSDSAIEHMRRQCHPASRLRPLVEWACHPVSAPDRLAWQDGAWKPSLLQATQRMLDKGELINTELDQMRRRQQQLEQQLAQLHGSTLMRWALRLRAAIQKFRRSSLQQDE